MNSFLLEQTTMDALIYEDKEFTNRVQQYLEGDDSLEESIIKTITPYYNEANQIFEGLIFEADEDKKPGKVKAAVGRAFDKFQKYTGIKKLRKVIGAALVRRGKKKYHEKAQVFKRKFRAAERKSNRNVIDLTSGDPSLVSKNLLIKAKERSGVPPIEQNRKNYEYVKGLYTHRGSQFKEFRKKYGGKEVQKTKKMIRFGKKLAGK